MKRSKPDADKTPPRWRCATCGAIFRAYAAAQRHADNAGHRRIITDLEGDS